MSARFFLSAGVSGSMLALFALALSPTIARAQDFDDWVRQAAEQNAIPSAWVRAVLQAESAGDPHAVSGAGAMGLMQLMPGTWNDVRRTLNLGTDPFDPHDNIAAGAAYLRWLYDRYGDAGFLAAYNAGPARYDDHLATGRPLPGETVSYVAQVRTLIENAGPFLSAPRSKIVVDWRAGSLFAGAKTVPKSTASATVLGAENGPAFSLFPASFFSRRDASRRPDFFVAAGVSPQENGAGKGVTKP
ncbi:lytic transglycosylase domain-containing protein [Gluconacetobacter azotocaptans]|uniref:lytic transglycosylase domain-containing protein n=1 Tax=Gluconacetobacter azotocaptans TaxID=142834 RepID=UPI001F04181A|nr:lytic transglycosylase domain-containing protein [Gluconacetobacter azotocaptans]